MPPTRSGGRPRVRDARLRARTRTQGRYISDLLGTPGHPRHGTVQGYRSYGCQCTRCTTAYSRERLRLKKFYKKNRKRLDGVYISTLLGTGNYPPHGSRSGYSYYRCECTACKAATTENQELHSFIKSKLVLDEQGRHISRLLGTKKHPKHGSRSGHSVYGCECDKCMSYMRSLVQKKRHGLKAQREEIDGRMVSTVLGTRGHPKHGTAQGYVDYFCRCVPCTKANTADVIAREKDKLGKLRMDVLQDVLSEHWPPSSPTPAPEDVQALARVLLEVWASTRRAREHHLTVQLGDHLAWCSPDLADHRAQVVTELLDRMAATRRGHLAKA